MRVRARRARAQCACVPGEAFAQCACAPPAAAWSWDRPRVGGGLCSAAAAKRPAGQGAPRHGPDAAGRRGWGLGCPFGILVGRSWGRAQSGSGGDPGFQGAGFPLGDQGGLPRDTGFWALHRVAWSWSCVSFIRAAPPPSLGTVGSGLSNRQTGDAAFVSFPHPNWREGCPWPEKGGRDPPTPSETESVGGWKPSLRPSTTCCLPFPSLFFFFFSS